MGALGFAVMVLVLTLMPATGSYAGELKGCILCGERAIADAALNLGLFAAFGWLMSAAGWPAPPLISLLFSAAIESLQLVVPGRDASPGDLIFNALGGWAGYRIWLMGGVLLRPSQRLRKMLLFGSALVAALAVDAPARLLQPARKGDVYITIWTPQLGHLERYTGSVEQARLGRLPLRPGVVPTDSVNAALRRGDPFEVSLVAGRQPERLAGIIVVVERGAHEILFLGAEQDRVLFRFRSRAANLRLDQPFVEWHALHPSASAGQVQLEVERTRRGELCARLADTARCERFTPGDGWTLLLSPEGWSRRRHAVVNALWLVGIFTPVGYWLQGMRMASAALVLPLLALAAPGSGGWVGPAPWSELLGAIVGLGAGYSFSRLLGRRPPSDASDLEPPGIS